MTSTDLSAFIPTNEDDAKKVGWGEMPFHSILTRLAAKTAGRDDPRRRFLDRQGERQAAVRAPSGSILAVRSEGKRWVELDIA